MLLAWVRRLHLHRLHWRLTWLHHLRRLHLLRVCLLLIRLLRLIALLILRWWLLLLMILQGGLRRLAVDLLRRRRLLRMRVWLRLLAEWHGRVRVELWLLLVEWRLRRHNRRRRAALARLLLQRLWLRMHRRSSRLLTEARECRCGRCALMLLRYRRGCACAFAAVVGAGGIVAAHWTGVGAEWTGEGNSGAASVRRASCERGRDELSQQQTCRRADVRTVQKRRLRIDAERSDGGRAVRIVLADSHAI